MFILNENYIQLLKSFLITKWLSCRLIGIMFIEGEIIVADSFVKSGKAFVQKKVFLQI